MSDLSLENYAFLQGLIHKESGIVLGQDKLYLIEARLLPIVKTHSLGSLNNLCSSLRSLQGSLKSQVVEAMTTNETLFFRDASPFQALRAHLLPPLIAERAMTKKLSFWSAAASSGQEAYSLAMLLLEMGLRDWNIQILGTDLNQQILDKAQAGRYLQIEVNRGLPAAYLVKYFQRTGVEWQIKDEVRRLVTFKQFDLRQSLRALGPFDFVFCRNVLIYFDATTKKKILGDVYGTLHRGGYLLLGSAETTINIEERFVRKPVGDSTFYQVP
ncbi:MAG: CheR family methyltransferase [Bryobacteraceae bacterium]